MKKQTVYFVDDNIEILQELKNAFTNNEDFIVLGSATNGANCIMDLRNEQC